MYIRTTRKRMFRPGMTTTASGYSNKCRLFYIHVSCHGYIIVADRAAEISVVSQTTKDNLTPLLYE